MLTPQEVEERVFPRAKKGGYDMQDVDGFLDQLTADFTELYKENAVLKRKMKVLADKITEYQETEGAMRATLLAAQKMADQLIEEAKSKQAQIIAETESIVRERMHALTADAAAEEARLNAAKASVVAVKKGISELLAHEQAFLATLPGDDAVVETPCCEEAPAEQPAEEAQEAENPVEEETAPAAEEVPAPAQLTEEDVKDIISRMIAEIESEDETSAAPAPAPVEQAPVAESAQEEAPVRPAADADVDDAPTRRMDLKQLRFGRNYDVP